MKKLKILLLSASMTMACHTYAVFGVGDIVSDPGSYGYYVEQLKSMATQVEQFTSITDKAQEVLDDSHEIF